MISKEPYGVWSYKTYQGKLTEYRVSNKPDTYKDDNWPSAAVFPVSSLFPEDFQRSQAHKYADYLNKVREATAKALEQQNLVDMLSRNTQP